MEKSLLRYVVSKMIKQDEWARKYNSYGKFDVNQYDYETQSDYLDALRKEWKWEVDSSDYFDGYVDVSEYEDFDSYESAIEEYSDRMSWKDKYDSDDKIDVNPCDFEDEEEYLSVLKTKLKEEYDFYNEYECIETNDYGLISDYEEVIDETKEEKF